jgi:hypothetical protein
MTVSTSSLLDTGNNRATMTRFSGVKRLLAKKIFRLRFQKLAKEDAALLIQGFDIEGKATDLLESAALDTATLNPGIESEYDGSRAKQLHVRVIP